MPAAPSPIDWRRAEQVAVALSARAPGPVGAIEPRRLLEMASMAEDRIAAVTGLRAAHPVVSAGEGVLRVIDRPAWIRANIESFRRLLAPLVEQWPRSAANPFTAAIAGAEVGVLLGWMSTRVLGQFDLLVGSEDDDAVYLVGPNLARLEQQFGFDPNGFRMWVLLHELTHRAQFTGVPWMRDHFTGLVDQSLKAATPDPATLLAAVRDAVGDAVRDRAAIGTRLREHGALGIVAGPEQRAVLARIGGLMSLLEGHGDVTMDRAAALPGDGIVPDAERYGRVLRERRRRASPLAKVVQRLLGFEAKLEQYAAGARFIAEIETVGGPRLIDRCWVAPEQLPSLDEIRRPSDWLVRNGVTEVAGCRPS